MYRSLYLPHSSVIIQFSLLVLHQHFFVSDQAVQVPMISAANTPTLLPLLTSVPAAKHQDVSFLRCCFVRNSKPRLHCWSSPMIIPHLDGNILVLHQLLDKIIESEAIFSFCGTFSVITSQPSSTSLLSRCAKAAHILHVSRTCSFSLYSTVRQVYLLYVSVGTDYSGNYSQ
jgi:hypothetical protein